MSPVITIAILIFVGILLLLLEVLVIPGTSIAGIGGFLLLAASVWVAFENYGTTGGIIVLIIDIVILVAAFVLALRSKTWRKLALKESIDSTIESFDGYKPQIGDFGIAISRLAPMGKVQINEHEFEARSRNAYIDENSEIEVIAVESNKVIVKHK
jgi:membrane-bound ClpP family serine protease